MGGIGSRGMFGPPMQQVHHAEPVHAAQRDEELSRESRGNNKGGGLLGGGGMNHGLVGNDGMNHGLVGQNMDPSKMNHGIDPGLLGVGNLLTGGMLGGAMLGGGMLGGLFGGGLPGMGGGLFGGKGGGLPPSHEYEARGDHRSHTTDEESELERMVRAQQEMHRSSRMLGF